MLLNFFISFVLSKPFFKSLWRCPKICRSRVSTKAEQDAGLRSAVPSSTEVLSARYVASDLVKVDLTNEIFKATGDDLVSSVAQIVLTLCDISGIERVIIVVSGQVNEWPKGDGSLTSQPLTAYDFPGRAISSQPAFPAIVNTLNG